MMMASVSTAGCSEALVVALDRLMQASVAQSALTRLSAPAKSTLFGLPFHSSASGSEALRLVMLFQLLSWDRSIVQLDEGQLIGRASSSAKMALAGHSECRRRSQCIHRDRSPERIGAFTEAVHGANVHAIGVLALDAVFGNDVSH